MCKSFSFFKFLLILIPLIAVLAYIINGAAPVSTGYISKYVCSGVFLSNRNVSDIMEHDIHNVIILSRDTVTVNVDYQAKKVIARFLNFYPSQAIYREGIGCTLHGTEDKPTFKKDWKFDKSLVWPQGDTVENYDIEIQLILQDHIKENFKDARTRAMIAVYKGNIVGEVYRNGFHKDTRLTGWSMTKSIMNALTGILVQQGKLKLTDKNLLAEWSKPNDPRAQITLDDVLRMSTGLAFVEKYIPFTDATTMLFLSNSTGQYAATKHLNYKPGTYWYYSSGTSNLLSYFIKQKVGGTLESYYNFIQKELFSKLKMNTIVIEPDASGTFVGSSFSWATARDWARFGLLYLQDGVWDGKRILPEDWVKYSYTPAPASNQQHGAHFWLNRNNTKTLTPLFYKLPQNMYHASGFCGQSVMIFPSHDLVIVRLGQDFVEGANIKPVQDVVAKILNSKLLRVGLRD